VASGLNDLAITFFDESDGVSTIDVLIDGVSVGIITLDQDGGGAGSQAANLRTVVLAGVTVGPASILSLVANSHAGEPVRIDAVEFTPAGAPPGNLDPELIGTISDLSIAQMIWILATYSFPTSS